jgi:hypothetical protein
VFSLPIDNLYILFVVLSPFLSLWVMEVVVVVVTTTTTTKIEEGICQEIKNNIEIQIEHQV